MAVFAFISVLPPLGMSMKEWGGKKTSRQEYKAATPHAISLTHSLNVNSPDNDLL